MHHMFVPKHENENFLDMKFEIIHMRKEKNFMSQPCIVQGAQSDS